MISKGVWTDNSKTTVHVKLDLKIKEMDGKW